MFKSSNLHSFKTGSCQRKARIVCPPRGERRSIVQLEGGESSSTSQVHVEPLYSPNTEGENRTPALGFFCAPLGPVGDCLHPFLLVAADSTTWVSSLDRYVSSKSSLGRFFAVRLRYFAGDGAQGWGDELGGGRA